MLDQQHRAAEVRGQSADPLRELEALRHVESGGRLVDQQQPRRRDERAGDFEDAAGTDIHHANRHVAGGQPKKGANVGVQVRPRVGPLARLDSPGPLAPRWLARQPQVLVDGHRVDAARLLERAPHPGPHALVHGKAVERQPSDGDAARIRRQESRNRIDERRLSGAIRADQRVHITLPHRQ